MHSLSFSGGPTPPTVVLISLLKLPRTTEHPNRLIARLEYNRRPKGWPAGFPALPLASFDAEESAAEEPGRGSGYPPPPLYGRNARYPRYFRVEKLHPGALSLFLFLFSVSYRGYLLPWCIYICIYIRSPLGSRKKDKFILEKKCLPGSFCRGKRASVTSLMVSRIFQMSRFYRWIGNFILDSRRSARTNDC